MLLVISTVLRVGFQRNKSLLCLAGSRKEVMSSCKEGPFFVLSLLFCQTQAVLRCISSQFDYFCPNPRLLQTVGLLLIYIWSYHREGRTLSETNASQQGLLLGHCQWVGCRHWEILRIEVPNASAWAFLLGAGGGGLWMGFTKFPNLLKLCINVCWWTFQWRGSEIFIGTQESLVWKTRIRELGTVRGIKSADYREEQEDEIDL